MLKALKFAPMGLGVKALKFSIRQKPYPHPMDVGILGWARRVLSGRRHVHPSHFAFEKRYVSLLRVIIK